MSRKSLNRPRLRRPSTDTVWSTDSRIIRLSSTEYVPRTFSHEEPPTRLSTSSVISTLVPGVASHTNVEDESKETDKHLLTTERRKKSSKSSSVATTRKSRASTVASSQRRYSGGGDYPSIYHDWNNAAGWTHMLGFNLELWWRRSSKAHRINAGLVAFLLTIAIFHLVVGVWFIWASIVQEIKSPYVCEEPECQKASQWISEFMDTKADPCDNFYEFICGNYHFELEKEGAKFDKVLDGPGIPIEFGENSILAKLLKDFRHDSSHDQSIEYYRNCLNTEIRKDFGLEALLETIEYVFGTRDFKTFESSTKYSLEEIGSRMFQVAGHAAYINMAFYTYPYIQIVRPSTFLQTLAFVDDSLHPPPLESPHSEYKTYENRKFVTGILQGLMPHLGVPKNSKLLDDMIEGVNMITSTVEIIRSATGEIIMPKSTDDPTNIGYQFFVEEFEKKVLDKGYCPPMGSIRLDIHKVLELFVQEKSYRIDFLDLMSLKYFNALERCFQHDPSTYKPWDPKPANPWTYKFTYPKSAFVAVWLVELFWDFHFASDGHNLLSTWHINSTYLPENHNVFESFLFSDTDTELICLTSMWRDLGYMPSIRFLMATQPHPIEFITAVEDELEALFRKISDIFSRIPPTEISSLQVYMGELMFSRGVYVDFLMPLVSGHLDESAVEDVLPFTKNHLRNSLIAVKYTVEKARQNWVGSTNTRATMKWWGDGAPLEIRYGMLDLREPFSVAAPFQEEQHAATKKLWELFLGQPDRNYVLFPLSLIHEPHITDTLALRYGGYIVKGIRTFLKFPQLPFHVELGEGFYTSLPDPDDLVDIDPKLETQNGADRKCHVLLNYTPRDETLLFQYIYIEYNVWNYSWKSDLNFFPLVALKEALRLFREERKTLFNMPFNWTIDENRRNLRMQRFLPGKKLSQFTEEQLFFMSYVRHSCRGSWKTHNDYFERERFFLETRIISILMQMEEFANAWNCTGKSKMNNAGYDRCMRWMPE